MTFALNIDILSVGIAVAGNLILGTVVFLNDRRSATAILFLLLSVAISVWSIFNYLTYQVTDLSYALWFERLVLFSAVPISIIFLFLIYTYPERKWLMSKKTTILVSTISLATMFLTLTPYIFSSVKLLPGVPTPQPTVEPGMGAFFVVAVLSIPLAIYFLIKKYIKATGDQKKGFKFLIWGVALMFSCIIFFDVILPNIYKSTRFIPLSAVFTFPFVAFTFYAIQKTRIFNVRAITVAVLAFVLCVSTFLEIIYSANLSQILLRSSVFLIVLVVSILMNKFVETIAEQREELQVANEGQENLIHIMNHQIKGYLGKARSIFAELMNEPEYCAADEAKPMLSEGMRAMTEGVDFVQQVLNGSNAARGTLTYEMKSVDFKKLVQEGIKNQVEPVAKKGLSMDSHLEEGDFNIQGDELQLREAVRNLIDNSVRYTLHGGLTVRLENEKGKVLLSIHDTGIGISKDDMPKLFTKGGKGKDSLKYNVNSTGYGLAFVKGVVDAHKGRVWAESGGPGKGSTFYMELPIS